MKGGIFGCNTVAWVQEMYQKQVWEILGQKGDILWDFLYNRMFTIRFENESHLHCSGVTVLAEEVSYKKLFWPYLLQNVKLKLVRIGRNFEWKKE